MKKNKALNRIEKVVWLSFKEIFNIVSWKVVKPKIPQRLKIHFLDYTKMRMVKDFIRTFYTCWQISAERWKE